MTKTDLIEALAAWYDIYPDEETGEYDLTSYDWEAGCGTPGGWLSLANVVKCLAPYCEEEDE